MVHQTMKISSASAPKASSRSSHIAAIVGTLVVVGCAVEYPAPPAPTPASLPPAVEPAPPPAAAVRTTKARWIATTFAELPGWERDRAGELWPALRRSCERPAPGWSALCAEALAHPPADDAAARAWLAQRLQPYRVESLDGNAEGLITGYYEPLIDASRRPRAGFKVPLHAPPADLATRQPYWTRQQLDTLPAAQAALRGREIAYVADAFDALVLQVQGSGRLRITEPGGRVQTVRLAFAGHNGQPYGSVGGWLVREGELRASEASLPAIRDWARRHPARLNEMLWSNPRVVFFREQPLPDPALGPLGAQGVPLTPGRSIAVDPLALPYGSAVWISTTEPLSAAPLQRVVMAQDTGSAITGAVRADYFWGTGDTAEQQAGRMKQALRMWVLWPRGAATPTSPTSTP